MIKIEKLRIKVASDAGKQTNPWSHFVSSYDENYNMAKTEAKGGI